MEVILQAHTETSGHDDHRFVATAHAWRQCGRIAADQIRRFVDAHAATVARAMRQSRQAVVRSQSGAFQHIACGTVHRFAGGARTNRGEGRLLRRLFKRPYPLLFGIGLEIDLRGLVTSGRPWSSSGASASGGPSRRSHAGLVITVSPEAEITSTASPMGCPSSSLIALKPSRSR